MSLPGRIERMESPAVERRLPEPLPADPMPTVRAWLDEARERAVQPNPDAMTLATIEPDGGGGSGGGGGRPAARIVLCKGINAASGFLVFFTNYRGAKGRALAANPRAALLFHWDALDRQVRVEGPVTVSPASESDEYFKTRPWGRKIGAWASDQSEPIASHEALRAKMDAAMRRFGLDPALPPAPEATVDVPRPAQWGGYRVWAQRVELWVGSEVRLHDRAVWERALSPSRVDGADGFAASGPWTATRLQP